MNFRLQAVLATALIVIGVSAGPLLPIGSDPTAVVGFEGSSTGRPLPQSAETQPDLATGLPGGMSVNHLASGTVERLPAHEHVGPTIRLERLPLMPGSSLADLRGTHDRGPYAQGSQLLYVERGELVVEFREGGEETLLEGEQLLLLGEPGFDDLPDGTAPRDFDSYDVRNDSLACASLLVLTFGVVHAQGVPVSSTAGPPGFTCGEPIRVEAGFPASVWPSTPAWFFIAGVTWEQGEAIGPVAFTGPVGLLVESGALAIDEAGQDAAISTQLRAGSWAVIPTGLLHLERVRYEEPPSDPARGVIAGVVPVGQALVVEQGPPG